MIIQLWKALVETQPSSADPPVLTLPAPHAQVSAFNQGLSDEIKNAVSELVEADGIRTESFLATLSDNPNFGSMA